MRALIKKENRPECMEVGQVDKSSCPDDYVLIRVLAGGVCGTDLHIRTGEWVCGKVPVVMGHEFCGEIAEWGKKVQGFQKGDRVVVEPHIAACGVCEYCLTGRRHLCPAKKGLGIDIDGGFAEFVAVEARLVHRLPAGVSPEEGALMEPTAIVCHGVLVKGRVRSCDRVAVVGPGPIGIIAAQVARAVGAREVMVVGVQKDRETRLKLCEDLQFKTSLAEDREAMLRIKTRSDVVVEASGVSKGIGLAVDLLKRDGQMIAIGIPMEDQSNVPWAEAVRKSATLHCTYSSSFTAWEMALTLVESGKVRLKPLITHDVDLQEWRKAFDALAAGKGVKAVLRP
ncbi:MAG: putative L-iditol 2-dehydrogenase [Deltaproteobacteria bacterium]|nr:putative L-iditol 2-dehydrogenase [Deltaproteobacteria bacterium]